MARRITRDDFGVVAYDCNGKAITVGTFIHWHWVTQTPFGELEDDIQGRIIQVKGRLCFKYRNERGKYSVQRLSALNYDPEADWEYCKEFSYHNNKFTSITVAIP